MSRTVRSGAFVAEGVVKQKSSALAIAVGDHLFWDAGNKVVNKKQHHQQCVESRCLLLPNPRSATVLMKIGCFTAVAA